MKNYSHLFFDCDGVILNSNKIKTDAFFELALKFGQKEANKLVNYHLKNGGISRYKKIKYFQEFIIKNNDKDLFNELLEDYGKIVRQKLINADISKGIYQIKNYFPKSKVYVISGSDQNELRWLFKRKKIFNLFNCGIYGSPKNKVEILEEIFSDFIGTENTIFFGDSKYDFQVSKVFKMDFVFISEWTDLKDWHKFAKINKLKSYKNVLNFFENN